MSKGQPPLSIHKAREVSEKVDKLRAEGWTANDAVKKVGIHSTTYNRYKKMVREYTEPPKIEVISKPEKPGVVETNGQVYLKWTEGKIKSLEDENRLMRNFIIQLVVTLGEAGVNFEFVSDN